jgi:transposase
MRSKLLELIQFITLFIALFVSSILFSRTASHFLRFSIIAVDALLYVGWGVWHHYSKDRFNKIIFMEYSLVAIIIIILAALGLGIVRFI